MKIDDKLYIENILESINLIEEYVKNISLNEFLKSRIRIDAVSKRLEEIGENASKISNSLTKEFSKTNWKKLKEMRNFLVHVYNRVKIERLYKEATEEIKKLKSEILNIKKEFK